MTSLDTRQLLLGKSRHVYFWAFLFLSWASFSPELVSKFYFVKNLLFYLLPQTSRPLPSHFFHWLSGLSCSLFQGSVFVLFYLVILIRRLPFPLSSQNVFAIYNYLILISALESISVPGVWRDP